MIKLTARALNIIIATLRPVTTRARHHEKKTFRRFFILVKKPSPAPGSSGGSTKKYWITSKQSSHPVAAADARSRVSESDPVGLNTAHPKADTLANNASQIRVRKRARATAAL